jgi:DNA-binding LacI/PurR family transcriptional regulator
VASIDDVARAAGVSTATVSRALSGRGSVAEDTREKVAQAAAELGYVVSASASSLATGRTRNVGIITQYVNRWFFSEVITGAQDELADHGYDVTLYTLGGEGPNRQRVFDEFLQRGRVDAVISIDVALEPDEVASLQKVDKPIIGVGGPIAGVRTIAIDDAEAVRVAMQHLFELGHRNIGFIAGMDANVDPFHVADTRRMAFEDSMKNAGLAMSPGSMEFADFTIPGGHAAALKILGRAERPTAILAASDEMAFGAIHAARELGISIPRDLSVVGIDGHDLDDYYGLTTVDQHVREQGVTAATILLDELIDLRAESFDHNTALPVELVVRSSTSAPR